MATMSILGWMTGGSKTAEKVVDGVSSGLDMMFYTDEEKSIASQKVLDWKLDYAKASANQSISRRVITCVISALWALIIVVAVVYGLLAGKDAEGTKYLLQILKDVVNPPFMIVVGFYFLAHVVGNARK